MEKYQSLIVNAKDIRIVNASDPTGFDDINTGDAVSTIKVYDAGTLDVSAIFSDDGVTPLSNPFNADADGVFFFYAANGNYDVIVNESLATESKDISVTLFDPSEADYATSAQGAKADSALQPGDNVSELSNDANYLSSIPTDYIKSGDNVSELSNDANYIKADNVSLINLDSPLFQGFQPNKLTTVSAPSGTDSDVTHTRASAATYIDRYGVLKTAGIDELRETADGYQIESVGSTNLLLWSEDFINAAWAPLDCSVISDAATPPVQGVLADKLVSTATNSQHIQRQNSALVAGDATASLIVASGEYTTFTLDIWNITDGVVASCYIDLTNGIVLSNTFGSVKVEARGGWWYVALSGVATVGGSQIRIYPNNNTVYLGDGVSGIYVTTAQIENLPFASSYMPTTNAPATRAPDIVSIPYENNVPRGDQPYTIIFKGIIDGYGLFNQVFGSDLNLSTYRVYSSLNSNGFIFHTNGDDSSKVKAGSIAFGEAFTYIITSDSINYTSYLNGNLQTSSAVTSPATELPNEMRILQGYSSNNNSNGTVSLFKTLPYALTADEVKLIS